MSHSDIPRRPATSSTQPPWINNMIVHIWPDCMAEFSTSGIGDDVPVFLEPDSDSLSIMDPSQRTPENQRVAAMQTDNQRGHERKKVEADQVGSAVVMLAQTTRPGHTQRNLKRKLDVVDTTNHPEKENTSLWTTKRICREKTGTDWQSILDIAKYSEEQVVIKEMKVTTKTHIAKE